MFGNILSRTFGSRNERVLKRLRKKVEAINQLEPQMQGLSDAELRGKTDEFRERLRGGAKLDHLLPEAFAVVRETSRRTLGMRHFDVQLIGGMALHEGNIAEMRTGEGKTLAATLPVYLNALADRAVHVVTVNDYLARRDAEWMGRIYRFLGLEVGVVVPRQEYAEKQQAYQAHVTYGTNNEFGFDYLRDNMAFRLEDKVQRGLNFAIVDEVDSILIDEARTPLIISGPAADSSELYQRIDRLMPQLEAQPPQPEGKLELEGPGDYAVDEKNKQVYLTESGHEKLEALLADEGMLPEGESLYDAGNIGLMHHINAALRAHALYQRDDEYIVRNGEVIIVDEFTGRTMPGRRWSEGLHQAIEAKEGVPIQRENQTLASITFQNYFRQYDKLAGMTGTADTEAFEFQQIYGLEVVVIPTHKPMIRDDRGDLIYLTANEKFNTIIEDIQDCVGRGQPVLVGTTSVETSEYLSEQLKRFKVPHQVLNAKHHEQEAEVIAQAGQPGTVTIATNMAGRGTDIVLGGNKDTEHEQLENPEDPEAREALEADWQARHEQVVAAGGLHIIGTERHESRRIDNQLRGRSGRQGDPGSSRFYLSLEDDLMRIFASDRMSGLMQRLGMQEGEAIEHPWVTKAIENAQRKVEAHNFDIRKNLLEYDNVANDQRKVIYGQRDELLRSEDISETIQSIREDVVNEIIDRYIPRESLEEQWDVPGLEQALSEEIGESFPIQQWLDEDHELHEETLRRRILDELERIYREKEEQVGAENMRRFEKAVMLQVLDTQWKEHLAAMDYLRQGIHLRGYAQRNPKQEFKRESFNMFQQMLERMKHEAISLISRVEVERQTDINRLEMAPTEPEAMHAEHAEANALAEAAGAEGQAPAPGPARGNPSGTAGRTAARRPVAEANAGAEPYVRGERKIGRNEPCWCGSGKKYKHCHGKLE